MSLNIFLHFAALHVLDVYGWVAANAFEYTVYYILNQDFNYYIG